MTQYRTHITDGILEKRRILLAVMPAGFCVLWYRNKSIKRKCSICIFSAFFSKNSRNCDKSCSTNRLKLKIRLKVQLVQKNINNCEYQKITITKQIKNRLTRTKSHFGDLVKAPPTLKSSCFFHIKLF